MKTLIYAVKAKVVKKNARIKARAWAFWWTAHHTECTYAQVRPMILNDALPKRMDCSYFFTLIYYLVGALDPNKLGYNGQGSTVTLAARGVPIKKVKNVTYADGALFGHGDSGHHIAFVVTRDRTNPMVISMGQDGDPELISAEDCAVAVAKAFKETVVPVRYLRFACSAVKPIGPPPVKAA